MELLAKGVQAVTQAITGVEALAEKNAFADYFKELEDAMNKYPICRCNEMTIMNLLLTFRYKLWKPFPDFCVSKPNKRLFGWTEHDRDYGLHTTWRDFCYIKYPSTINFDCE